MRPLMSCFMLGAALALAAPALSQGLDDRHLSVIPRSDTDRAKVESILAPVTDFSKPEKFEGKPGGAATVRLLTSADAFSQFSANMPFDRQLDFKVGNGLFRKTWVAAPASTLASDGLGPFYNARGCQDCHLKDGRGQTPSAGGGSSVSLFLRLSVPGGQGPEGIADYLASLPDPTYGTQLQEQASPGLPAEGHMSVTYTDLPVTFADGTIVTLRSPTYTITDLAHGHLNPATRLSPRLAPQMIGLGLLEAIPAAEILAREDPDDRDGGGISGRANVVMSGEHGVPMLGRFGFKAGMPSIREQSAGAFSGDMGLSTWLHPDPAGDCTLAQTACRTAPDGQEAGIRDGLEVDKTSLDLVTFYARNLAVPERRNMDAPPVLQGKALFHDLGCVGCHTPKHVTNRLKDQPEQSFQLIWPYTDLLLHDMGEGLADHRPEARASGTEWRTAPLWGIGLTAQVSGQTEFLHDGRARSPLEAVLWHGGEAQASRDAVLSLPEQDRAALIAFLESL